MSDNALLLIQYLAVVGIATLAAFGGFCALVILGDLIGQYRRDRRIQTGFLKPMPKLSTKDTHTRKARKLPGAAA